jgi:hypothetical protein
MLYLIYTADLPNSTESPTATFADDTAVVATDSDPGISSQKLQTNLNAIKMVKEWTGIKAGEYKSVHVTFTTRRGTCPSVHINSVHLPQQDVKYVGLHLDSRLTWRKHIFTKRKQLGMTLTKCIGYLDGNQNPPQATTFSYTKQHSNQSGIMQYSCGVRLPLQI